MIRSDMSHGPNQDGTGGQIVRSGLLWTNSELICFVEGLK